MNVRLIARTFGNWCKQHSTKILAGVAIVSEGLGFYFMHREAPIVRDRLDELGDDAKWYEKIKVAGPVYLPALGMFLLSSGSIVGGCVIGDRKAAAAMALYSVTDAALHKTEAKLVEVLGDEKAQEVHNAVANDILKSNPVAAKEVSLTGKGNVLFYEPLSGRYFRSSLDAVKNANVDFKEFVIRHIWGSANDWYTFLGLERANLANFVGWNVEHNMNAYFDEGHTVDGELCWVIRHINKPILGDGCEPINYDELDQTL